MFVIVVAVVVAVAVVVVVVVVVVIDTRICFRTLLIVWHTITSHVAPNFAVRPGPPPRPGRRAADESKKLKSNILNCQLYELKPRPLSQGQREAGGPRAHPPVTPPTHPTGYLRPPSLPGGCPALNTKLCLNMRGERRDRGEREREVEGERERERDRGEREREI